MCLFQRKSDGLWVEVVQVAGRERRITAKSKSALLRKLRDYATYQELGPKFEDVADAWEIAHSKDIAETTSGSYGPHVRRAKEYFAGERVSQITTAMCQAYIADLVAKDYARDTVRRAKNVLEQIFTFAIAQPGSTLRYNPVAATKIPRGLKHTRREPPTEEQLVKVDASTKMGLFAAFLLFTGMRRGELLALRWEDIDRENKLIHISRRAQYAQNVPVVTAGAKTEAGTRSVPLLDQLAAVLPAAGAGYVFGGEVPLTHTQFHKRWIAWCREVGLAEEIVEEHIGKNGHRYKRSRWKAIVTPHQFRHKYASLLYYAGADELETKTAMGHSSIAVTHEIYVHISERDHVSKTGDKLNSYIAEHGV